MVPNLLTEKRSILPAAPLIFLAAAGLYLAGTMPSLYGGDSGELTAAALSLGVAHAPGYPLFALAGKACASVVPWGGPAYRVNLLSAILSALTVAGIFFFLRSRSGIRAALAGSGLYAALPLVWDQAQGAEVFALNNAFALGLIWLFDCGTRNVECGIKGVTTHLTNRRDSMKTLTRPSDTLSGLREREGRAGAYQRGEVQNNAAFIPSIPPSAFRIRHLLAWAFLYGLGLANHQTLLLLAPGFVLALAWRAKRDPLFRRGFLRLAGMAGAAFALGLTLYLYLPLRSAQHPPVNFGDPHTPGRFWRVVTRQEFGTLELHPAAIPFRTAGTLMAQAGAFLRNQSGVAGAAALGTGLLGLVLARRDWFLAWFLAGPFFYVFSNLSPFNTLAQWRMERFLLLPGLFLALGVGLLAGRFRRWMAVLLILALAAEQAALPRPWFRWNLAFRDFGRNVCASLAPRSILVIDRVLFDEPTSCLLNELVAERRRPDLRVLFRPGTLFEPFYGEDILELPLSARLARQREREEALWRRMDRPAAALALLKENLPPFPLRLSGVVYAPAVFPPDVFYRRRDGLAPPRDYPTRLILAHYPYFAAKAALESDDAPAAARASAASSRAGGDMEWLESNLGSLWSRWGAARPPAEAAAALERARVRFERAAAIDPYFPPARFGLGYARLQERRFEEASQEFRQAAALKPGWEDAYYMWGLSRVLAGRMDLAREPWGIFLSLAPDSPLAAEVRRTLAGRS